ncbi:DeoR/GlpR family DNA-binding transcription regulator [Dehalobacter sp. DCM]|uniref:DeoR/GlpR family DNA-binding transcription regulator n=1 Tax=Dehalobacter sp. DCM TaxID=2907827 RepID=UPI003081CB76|nr:DeoR/GlpR family DNA-binding transcription regulator [Dehalobacter sp. DCM]
MTAGRQEKIRFLLQKHGHLTVAELAEEFNVSEMTIRRDLKELALMGLIQREHGKAIYPQNPEIKNTYFTTRLGEAQEEKLRIAKIAASLINEGESVILDSGTTTLAIALELNKKSTVVTNSLAVAEVLAMRDDISTVLTGGEVQKATYSLLGPMTRENLNGFYADKLFLSATGVSAEKGLSTSSMIESEVKQAMIASAREVILVAHGSKIGQIFYHIFAKWDKVNKFITDNSAAPEQIKKLEQLGIEVIIAS